MLLGLVIVIGLILGGIGLFTAGSRQWVPDAFRLRAQFKEAAGVVVGTRVHVLGQDAGEVELVELPATHNGLVTLHLRVAGKFRHLVRDDSVVQIVDESLFGGKIVRIVSEHATGDRVADNAMLKGMPPGSVSDQLVNAGEKLLTGRGPLAKSLKELEESSARLNIILAKAEAAVHDVHNGKGTIGKLLKEEKMYEDMVKTMNELNYLVAEVKQGKGTLGKLVKDEKLYDELVTTLKQVNVVVMDVQDGKGSLGKLLNNTELYLEALKSLKDLQGTMASFKQNADAIKALPVISSYVVDVGKELNRPGSKRHRIHFAIDKIFDGNTSVLSADGRKALDAAADWLNDRKDEGSEVVVAAFADPKKHAADFAATLTQKQSEAVADYLKTNHKIHRMGFWWWSNRRVVALGCGTTPSPVPEKDKLPPGRLELIVFVPIK
jgi:phospholipid/cholesterol/gamma-HCH transport system substrate-binding protein